MGSSVIKNAVEFDNKFRLLLDKVPSGIMLVDELMNILWCNQWILKRIDKAEDQIYNNQLSVVFPEIAERNLEQAFELVFLSGLPLTLSNRIHNYFIKIPADDPNLMIDDMPQSVVISPLYDGDDLIAAMVMIQDVTERVLSEKKLQYELKKLNVLHDVDQAIATLDMESCLSEIVKRAKSLFEADHICLYLCEGKDLSPHQKCSHVRKNDDKTDFNLIKQVGMQQKALLIRDTSESEYYHDFQPEHKSEMTVPMISEEKTIGVISVQSRKSHKFLREDLFLLESLAGRAAQAVHNARLHEEEQRQRKLAEALAEVTISIASELELNDVLDRLLDSIAIVTPYDSASIFLEDEGKIQVKRHRGYDKFGTAATIENSIWDLSEMPLVREIISKNRPLTVPDVDNEPLWRPSENAKHVRSWCGTPIFVRGKLLGFISLDKTEAGYYTEDIVSPLLSFAASAGIAIQNARLYARQVSLANMDGLTGLPNRHRFDKRLAEEMQRTVRYGHPTSLIFLDIDKFKLFNDTYGHLVGDDVLKEIAKLLNRNLRIMDIPARYGGEEFAVILPQTGLDDAYLVAERIRSAVESNQLFPDLNLIVTISAGVAMAPLHAKSPKQIIDAADKALYQAKNSGRNRVIKYKHEG